MVNFFLELSPLLLSSAVTVALTFLKTPLVLLQQIISVLIIVMLLLLRNLSTKKESIGSTIAGLKWFIFFATSLLVQLIVASSGGIFSPFLILFHLFALGISFIINFRASTVFLSFSIITLIIYSGSDPFIRESVLKDLSATVLYAISFITIIPIARLLSTNYHLKDNLSKLLSNQIKLEQSILEGVTEMVFVTDIDMKLLSANEVVEKKLHQSSESVSGKFLLDVVDLRNSNNVSIDRQFLSVDSAISENSTRIIKDLFLYLPNAPTPIKVSTQVKPVLDSEGKLQNISFIIIPDLNIIGDIRSHKVLEKARNKYKILNDQFRQSLSNAPLDIRMREEIISKMQEDLILSAEIEDHPLKVVNTIVNVDQICKEIIDQNPPLTKLLDVKLEYGNPVSYDQKISDSTFIVTLDSNWLKILIQKIIDLATLLSSHEKQSKITLVLVKAGNFIEVVIKFPFYFSNPDQQQDIFTPYYGNLSALANLKLGSGLEGFIAKSLSVHLNIPIRIIQYPEEKHTAFVLYIPILFDK